MREVRKERDHALRVTARHNKRILKGQALKSNVENILKETSGGLVGVDGSAGVSKRGSILVGSGGGGVEGGEGVTSPLGMGGYNSDDGSIGSGGGSGDRNQTNIPFNMNNVNSPTTANINTTTATMMNILSSDSSSSSSSESVASYTGVMKSIAKMTRILPASMRLDKDGQLINKQRMKTYNRQVKHQERMSKMEYEVQKQMNIKDDEMR